MKKTSLSALERIKAQAEVLVPVLRALRAELGTDRANKLVFNVLRKTSRDRFAMAASRRDGSGQEKWKQLNQILDVAIGDAVKRKNLRDDQEALDFDITECGFASFFQSIQEPELGAVMTCEVDRDLVATSGNSVKLEREKTIMNGDDHCPFRYRFIKES